MESVLKSNSPIYGGSAADNTIGGQWKIFNKNNISDKGFVLVGFVTERPVYGAFVSGYLPTQSKGKVTKAKTNWYRLRNWERYLNSNKKSRRIW